jgi:hypothetical protein
MARSGVYSTYIVSNFARTTFYMGLQITWSEEYMNIDLQMEASLPQNTNVIILCILKITVM